MSNESELTSEHRPSAPQDESLRITGMGEPEAERLWCDKCEMQHAVYMNGNDIYCCQCNSILLRASVSYAKPVAPDSGERFEEGASLIKIVRPTATELWESLESFLNSLHKGVCGDDSSEGLDHAQFVVMALRPMIAALESRPEGDSKVTWRVDYEDAFKREYSSEEYARKSYAEAANLRMSSCLVKIETRETVVEARKKEA